MEAARASMIMQARSVAERARMSSRQLEEVSQEGLILPVTPTSAPPAVAPPSAAAPTAFVTPSIKSMDKLAATSTIAGSIVPPLTGELSPVTIAKSPAGKNLDSTGVCPCCGDENSKLIKRIGQGIMAVLISANRDFNAHFKAIGIKFENHGSSIMTCQMCQILGSGAVKEARGKFPDVAQFKYLSSNKKPAVEANKKITCGTMTMVHYN
jgi:hypothetical protein